MRNCVLLIDCLRHVLTLPSLAAIPAQESWKLTKGGAYVHICANETIGGVEFKVRVGNTPPEVASCVPRRPSSGPTDCSPDSPSWPRPVQSDPVVDGVLIADMSSNYLSKPIDVSKYGVRSRALPSTSNRHAHQLPSHRAWHLSHPTRTP